MRFDSTNFKLFKKESTGKSYNLFIISFIIYKRLTAYQQINSTESISISEDLQFERIWLSATQRQHWLPSHFSRICTVSPISSGSPCWSIPRKFASTEGKTSKCVAWVKLQFWQTTKWQNHLSSQNLHGNHLYFGDVNIKFNIHCKFRNSHSQFPSE